MKTKKLAALLMATIMMVFSLAGCGGTTPASPASEPPAAPASQAPAAPDTAAPGNAGFEIPADKLNETLYVGVSIRTLTNPYLVTIKEGAEMFCKYLDSIGQKYEMQVLSCEGSNEKQVNDIKAFVSKANGNAILYVDPNEAAIAPAIADVVEEAGAYMVTAWNKPDDVSPMDYNNWISHHSPDDRKSGHDTAVTMFSNFETPGKGKMLAVQGMLGNTAAANRFAGLEDALKEYPDVTLVEEQTGNWDTQEALKVVETWLSKYDDIDGIWCANDNMALGTIQALKAKGLAGKVKVTGVDCIDDVAAMIKTGEVSATVASNGWLQGGYSLAICYAVWTGEIDVASLPAEKREFNTEGILVAKDTVDAYEAQFIKNKPSYDFSQPFDCIYVP